MKRAGELIRLAGSDSGLASMAEMHFAHLSSPEMQAMRYYLKVDIKYISMDFCEARLRRVLGDVA